MHQQVARVWLLLVSAIPLVFALKWSAINCPIDPSEYKVCAIWVDDQYAMMQFQYFPIRRGFFRGQQCVLREYLVDCNSHSRTQLFGEISRSDFWSSLPEIAPDGAILRTYADTTANWVVHRINPSSLDSKRQTLDLWSPIVIGGRFLASPAWDSAWWSSYRLARRSLGLCVSLAIAISIGALLEAGRFDPLYFREDVRYGCYRFLPLAGSVAILSYVRRLSIGRAKSEYCLL